jgi:hypothetical protein
MPPCSATPGEFVVAHSVELARQHIELDQAPSCLCERRRRTTPARRAARAP